MTSGEPPVHRKARNYRWDGVAVQPYKEDTRALFKAITRQVLFADPQQGSELRYFEVAPGGFSTLERHEHTHNVLILRGHGHCLVGSEVREVATHDLIAVPPMTWHQFRAIGDEPLGFLCMVNTERDKPQLPTPQELAEFERDSRIADFFKGIR
jgi:mannose-6-phosphate isomerase-like protein (cupin superfamily)